MTLTKALVLAFVASAASAAEFPGVQPQLASEGQRVGLVFGDSGSIQFALSKDGGRTFTAPVVIPSQGILALGRHRGPRVAMGAGAIVVTAILGASRGDGNLFAWRSSDDGRSWAGPVRLNAVPASAREGLHGMAAAGKRVAAVWLDLREPGMRIRAVVSQDAGASWSEDRLVYESPSGSVCECCHPSVAVSTTGQIAVMFRNALAGARDMYLTTSRDGGNFDAATKLGNGTWKLEACPMDGGGIAIDARGGVATVWRRDREVFFARPGQPEQLLGQGRDPAIALGRDGAWSVVFRGDEGVLMAGAEQAAPRTLAEGAQAPVLLALDDGSWLAAWERDKHVVVAPGPAPTIK